MCSARVCVGGQFHSFAYGYLIFPVSFVENFSLSDCLILLFFQKSIDHRQTGLFLHSFLFHWSLYVPLCQYHIVLINEALYLVLKSRSVNFPTFFFSRFLFIWDPTHFHMNFKVTLFISDFCNSFCSLRWSLQYILCCSLRLVLEM